MLTFEWILMVALLVIGLIGGLSGLRNAVLDQLQDLELAVEGMNFSAADSTAADSSSPTAHHGSHGRDKARVAYRGGDDRDGRVARGSENTKGNELQFESNAPSRDTPSSHDTSGSDVNAWWGAGYR